MSVFTKIEGLRYEIDLITRLLEVPMRARQGWLQQRQAEHPVTGEYGEHAIISSLRSEACMQSPKVFEQYVLNVREGDREMLDLL